ncbi:MAG TPA: OPT/YSL family transporter, partial [Lacibacter sp.]|nr:OPT/YSL family transporter [Lacibacter sp.]
VLVGDFIAIPMELCGTKSLSFAVGLYLPLSTTLPIFAGGAVRGLVEWKKRKAGDVNAGEEEDLGKGNLFATGLVAGGALAGVVIAFLSAFESTNKGISRLNLEHRLVDGLSANGYYLLGALFFVAMGLLLYRIGIRKTDQLDS